MNRLVAIILVIGFLSDTSGALQAGIVTALATAPTIDGADIANLANPGPGAGAFDPGGNEGHIWSNRPIQGQTFTTGGSGGGYLLSSVTLQDEENNINNNASPFTVRIGTISGNTFTQIASENSTNTVSYATNDFMTFAFASPVSLSANTVYGFEWDASGSGFTTWNNADTNYAGGTGYSSGGGGNPDDNNLVFRVIDRVFHVDMEPAVDVLTWDGAINNWGTAHWIGPNPPPPPNWPDATIAAQVDSGTVTVEANHAAAALDVTGGEVVVGAGNTLTVVNDLTAAPGSMITMGPDGTLTVGGNGSIASLRTGGNATINTGGPLSVSGSTFDGGGVTGTFTKTGPGTLSLDNSDGTGVIGVENLTFDVHEGTLYSIGAQPLGGTGPTTGVPPAVILSGGVLSVEGAPTTLMNQLNYAYYNNAASNNLQNIDDGVDNDQNGGLFALTPTDPGSWPAAVQGKAVWTGEVWQGGNMSDTYCQMWWGNVNVPATLGGVYTIYVHGDDYELFWLDTGQDGDFEAGFDDISRNVEGEEGWNTPHTETVTLTGGQTYQFAIAHREGGGGDWVNVTVTPPAFSAIPAFRINPSDPAQAGLWSATGVGAINMTGTPITVTANSGLNAMTEAPPAAFGHLTLNDAVTLSTSGAPMTFLSTTLAGNSATLDVGNDVTAGPFDAQGATGTFTKTGPGTLSLDNSGGTGVIGVQNMTFDVHEGTLYAIGAQPLGGTDPTTGVPLEVILSGGTLEVEGATVIGPGRSGWDFEDGTLDGWNIVTSPWGGNTVFNAGANPTNTQGAPEGNLYINTWHGSDGNSDNRTGIIRTDPFIIADEGGGEQISMMMAGGGNSWNMNGDPDVLQENWCAVVLEHEVTPGDWEKVYSEIGANNWNDSPRTWDTSGHVGETMRISVYDTRTGGNWAFTTVDDIVFSSAPGMPTVVAVDMTSTPITVTASSRLTAISNVGADFGNVTVHDGAALTTGGTTPDITFTQAILPGGRGTYKPELPTILTGTSGLSNPGGVPSTLVAGGTSDLILNRPPADSMANVTLEGKSGRLVADYANGDPTGGADIVLTGGTLTAQGAPGTGFAYGRVNYGYYDNAASNNLQNIDDGADNAGTNNGLFNLTPTPEASWPSQVQGKALWTGEVWLGGISDTYCQMWSGRFKAPTTGPYEFYVHGDDYEILWIDVDGDHDFEASNNEDISRNVEGEEGWNTPHTETVTLQGGTVYDFALAHREGGGGDFVNVTIKAPDGSAERINPSAAGQQGWWAGDGPLTEAIDMQNTLTVDNVPADGLRHLGYHINNDGLAMDLDGNAGMMGAGDPASFQNLYGEAMLVDGPGGRGLDFNDDNDFINTGAIGQNDNYSNLFLATLHVEAADAGNWEFVIRQQDDPTGIWIDLDQDGVFESSVPGLGSDRGEQLSWNQTNSVKTVSLAEGDYLVAFTHREGGGGSHIDARFRSPTMGTEAIVHPADPAQAGLWSVIPTSTLELITDLDANLRELILKNGDLVITGGNLLTVEQASVSTATSGKVGLITETPTILTDVLGFNGNGQTVEITKAGSADLILNKAGTGLDNATFNVKEGTLVGYASGNPFGGAALKLTGGDLLLSASLGSTSPVDYDNPVTVEADAQITAGQGTGGQPAPMTVNLGSAGNNVTVAAGKTLTMRSTDGYSLNVAGQVNGGNLMVPEGTVALSGGGTVANMEVKTAATASTPGVTITDGGRYTARDGDLTVSGSGASFEVGGVDLGNAPDRLGILGGTVTVAGPAVIPTSGLVGKWTFDDDTADDSSGNNHHGQARDGAAYSSDVPTTLAGGRSIDLTSANAHVLVDTGGSQDVFDLDTITVATWVKGWPDGSWNPYISKRGEGGQGWQLRRHGGSDRLSFTLRGVPNEDGPQGASNIIQQDGDWHHVVAMYDGANRWWYIDGVLDGSDFPNDPTITDTAYRLVFGARNNSDSDPNNIGNHSHAQLDDIYIYDRAVTEAEASALLNNFTAKPALDLPGTDITVATDATLFSDTDSTATYGDLSMAPAVTTLTLSGAPKGISFDVVSGNATVNLTDPDSENEMRIRGGIRPGDSVGTLVVNGNLTVEDGVVYEWELGPDGPDAGTVGDHDLVEVGGTLTFDVGDAPEQWVLELVDAGGEAHAWDKLYLFSGSPFETDPMDLSGDYLPYEIRYSSPDSAWWEFTDPADLQILRDEVGLYLFGLQTVPEPGTLVLLALGGLGLLVCARRRRRAR